MTILPLSFWLPVSLEKNPGTHPVSKFLWQIGSCADRYLYLGNQTLCINASKIDTKNPIHQKTEKKISPWETAAKVASYLLTCFLLPLFALPAKIAFKSAFNQYLNDRLSPFPLLQQPTEPSKIVRPPTEKDGVQEKVSVELEKAPVQQTSQKIVKPRIEKSDVQEKAPAQQTSQKIVKPQIEKSGVLKKAPVQQNQLIVEKQIGETTLSLLKGNILWENTDAIVNAANATLASLGGICGAIHSKAGPELENECFALLKNQSRSKLNPGEAVMTIARNLMPQIKYVIHAVGPNCGVAAENAAKEDLLEQAYLSSLNLSCKQKENWISPEAALSISTSPLRSISFPSISTGIFGFPLDVAAQIALKTIKTFIENNPKALDKVRFIFLPSDKTTMTAFEKAFKDL